MYIVYHNTHLFVKRVKNKYSFKKCKSLHFPECSEKCRQRLSGGFFCFCSVKDSNAVFFFDVGNLRGESFYYVFDSSVSVGAAVTESLSYGYAFFVKVVCTVAEFLLEKKVALSAVLCEKVDNALC